MTLQHGVQKALRMKFGNAVTVENVPAEAT
jgi:hypothetical protein